jgi:hypothetical protein
MKQIFKVLVILFTSFLWMKDSNAQMKPAWSFKPSKMKSTLSFKQSTEDSLINKFQNNIYYSFYNPSYMVNTVATFTILKIDINRQGKVTNIQFSDSADSTFVKAYLNYNKDQDNKTTLEKYAEIKSYKDISLLIPISYEPNYPYQKKLFSYDELESMLKFNQQVFVGKSMVFSPIIIAPTGM